MRDFINEKLYALKTETARMEEYEQSIVDAQEEAEAAEEAKEIMQKAAKMSQDHLAYHLSSIVTQAVQAVVEKPYEFVCEFVERRGTSEADLYLMKDGKKYDILDGTGGGIADVCSFSLKIAYLMLSNNDKVLIIDEVSRHINSPRQRENFADVMRKLSDEFQVQMIINSTVPEYEIVADKVFRLSQVNNETKVNA